MNRKLRKLLFAVIASGILAMANLAFSSPATQGRSRNGNLQITQFYHVLIKGDDMGKLPTGENRIIQKPGGGNAAGPTRPTGSVTFFIDGVGQSTALSKIGTGTLILPNSNSAGVTKAGRGTLVLGAAPDVVYEFRNLTTQDFDRVFMPDGQSLKAFVQRGSSPNGMNGWPFRQLFIGPAKGVAQVKGWKPGAISNGKPGDSKYVCTTSSCSCSGLSDCLKLADSGSCRGSMVCNDQGCWCSK